MVKLAIAISGRGSNLQALTAGMAADCRFAKPLVVASRPCEGLNWAREQGLETVVLPYGESVEAAEAALDDLFRSEGLDGLLLAGFMRVLSADFLAKHSGQVLNIHPSLLPKFKGSHALADFWASDEAESGVSVHIVTPELDGGPLLAQTSVPRASSFEAFEAAVHRAEHGLYWPVAQAYFTR